MTKYLFSPKDAVAYHQRKRAEQRKTKPQASRQNNRKANPKRTPGDRYKTFSYEDIGVGGLELPSGYHFFCHLGELSDEAHQDLSIWLQRYWTKGDLIRWLRETESAFVYARVAIRKLPKSDENQKRQELLKCILSACDDFERALSLDRADIEKSPQHPYHILNEIQRKAEFIRSLKDKQRAPIISDADENNDTVCQAINTRPAQNKREAEKLLQFIMTLPTPTCGKKGDSVWVHCSEVARCLGIETESLASYRIKKKCMSVFCIKLNENDDQDEENREVIAGVDKNGRAWRKHKPGAQVFYHRNSVGISKLTIDFNSSEK